jgi:hypothetical protein
MSSIPSPSVSSTLYDLDEDGKVSITIDSDRPLRNGGAGRRAAARRGEQRHCLYLTAAGDTALDR